MEQIEAYRQQFDHYLSKFRTLNQIEAKTQVPKVYIALAGYLLISVSVFFNLAAGLTTNLIGLIYPSYRLFEAAKKSDAEGLRVYGVYFAIFAALDTIEELFLDLITHYFPYYYVAKLVFLCWLFFPGYLGAKVIYGVAAPHFAALSAEPKAE
ncbi:ER membrane protein DP1/Yop1 [Blyttiomyces sp. JEL0837]|nr:ER membrane protein DP1/Yop1 [Blyttiomyces sp. JEL0837]